MFNTVCALAILKIFCASREFERRLNTYVVLDSLFPVSVTMYTFFGFVHFRMFGDVVDKSRVDSER